MNRWYLDCQLSHNHPSGFGEIANMTSAIVFKHSEYIYELIAKPCTLQNALLSNLQRTQWKWLPSCLPTWVGKSVSGSGLVFTFLSTLSLARRVGGGDTRSLLRASAKQIIAGRAWWPTTYTHCKPTKWLRTDLTQSPANTLKIWGSNGSSYNVAFRITLLPSSLKGNGVCGLFQTQVLIN